MIKAVFDGGLGNQMFLYAYIYSQIRKNNLDAKIYAVMNRTKYEDRREFALNALNCSIKMDVVDRKKASFMIRCKIILREQLCRVLQKVKINNKDISKIFGKMNICYTPDVFEYYPSLNINNNSYVEGNFQTWKYFKDYENELMDEFKITKKISMQNKEVLNNINSTNAVCVHIRRGDYLNSHFSKFLKVCDYNYYKKAMDYMSSKLEKPTFYIFSNSHKDHEWIKQNYKFGYDTVNVDLDNPDYEELRLMSACKHFILSNSTFSWWAQFLSKNKNKCVVAPSKWHIDQGPELEDIYMPNWKIIEV